MTIFDSLRYPISDVPTVDELKSLPKELFDKWVSVTEWGIRYNYKDPQMIGEWYQCVVSFNPKLYKIEIDEIKLLKKMIYDWDENELV